MTQVIDSGIVTAAAPAGTNVLQDATKNWATGALKSYIVKITEGAGVGQLFPIEYNIGQSIVITGSWIKALSVNSHYEILAPDIIEILRDVFGGGANISALNPLPVDTSPGEKTATEVLDQASIAAGATTVIGDCADIDLSGGPPTLALTVEATYNAAATLGIRVHIRTSYDGTNWDTLDWDSWTAGFAPGSSIRQTKHYDGDPMYCRVLVENLDPVQAVTDVKVTATVGA